MSSNDEGRDDIRAVLGDNERLVAAPRLARELGIPEDELERLAALPGFPAKEGGGWDPVKVQRFLGATSNPAARPQSIRFHGGGGVRFT